MNHRTNTHHSRMPQEHIEHLAQPMPQPQLNIQTGVISIVSEGQLRKLFREELEQLVYDAVAMARQEAQSEYMTTNEVAEFLNCTTQAVRNMARDGRLPAIRVHKHFQFLRREIIKVREERHHHPEAV